jgi:cellobiose transport system substrate-binding protein
VARNGSVVGLGTDIGSLAICYRRDDFAKAGLPTNREAVGRLWPSWKDFIRVGERFQAHAPNGLHFFDGGANVFGAIVAQARPAYYSSTGRVIVDTNPKVKEAWDTTMLGIRAGESASFGRFSMDWDKGFQSGIFATITCPAWMMGYIQGLAPKAAGKWDIATPPGDGGNWGGSFLAVPRQSQHQELAAELAKFLTSPASELYVFKQTGNLPSLTALLRRPEVQKLRSKYFHNAPVGEIFAASALRLEPQAVGARQGDIQNAAAVAVSRVEHGNMSARASWAQFLKDIRALR